MPKLSIYNTSKEEVGSIELPEAIFAAEVREHLFYEAVRYQLAKRRAGTHSTKGRAEVNGGGRKPLRYMHGFSIAKLDYNPYLGCIPFSVGCKSWIFFPVLRLERPFVAFNFTSCLIRVCIRVTVCVFFCLFRHVTPLFLCLPPH